MHSTFSSQPLVSVITPSFNGERFIRRVVESVRQQRFSVEHIIVDDCSSDGSWDLLVTLSSKYPWVKPIRLEKNLGPVFARNKAIEIAGGRFIAFLDVDDVWLPSKLSIQIPYMIANNAGICFTDYRFMTEDGVKVGKLLKGPNRVGWYLHHATRYIGCLTVIIDRNHLPNFYFPPINPSYRAEDFLAFAHAIKKCGYALRCPDDLARYSVVSSSRSSNLKNNAISVWRIYRVIEKISIITSIGLFISYALLASYKRLRFRPTNPRASVDNDFEWSLLR